MDELFSSLSSDWDAFISIIEAAEGDSDGARREASLQLGINAAEIDLPEADIPGLLSHINTKYPNERQVIEESFREGYK